ncbi:hypothetical protein NE686_06905 [Tissierella carlieri]|uniref:Bacteriocin n=1 Tax=Tissierella carlieri TaxID=689904 RepID=A0ABT1S8K5_9FIRM|nr:hypothetical protein [Tissierella carlieri]MCQ4922805.1 hypothetical protein [Tissierella carlieri]
MKLRKAKRFNTVESYAVCACALAGCTCACPNAIALSLKTSQNLTSYDADASYNRG